MARKRFEDEGGDADEDDAAPKGVKTSTKVVLVAAGWVLLTLFLIGQFSADGEQASDRARLDTVAGTDLDGDGEIDEVVEEEATDVNGDGIIELGEGVEEGEATATGETDDGSASGDGTVGVERGDGTPVGSGGGSFGSGGTSGGADDGSGTNAVPGAAPSGGSTATTTRTGGGGSPATTAAPSSGGSTGGTTGGGSGGGTSGSSTTTTTSAGSGGSSGGGGSGSGGSDGGSGTTPTSASPAPADSPIILIIKARNNAYVYPPGYGPDFRLPTGSQIRLDNTEDGNGTRHTFTIVNGWDSGDVRRDTPPPTSPPLGPGTYLYSCRYHPTTMRGTLTVD